VPEPLPETESEEEEEVPITIVKRLGGKGGGGKGVHDRSLKEGEQPPPRLPQAAEAPSPAPAPVAQPKVVDPAVDFEAHAAFEGRQVSPPPAAEPHNERATFSGAHNVQPVTLRTWGPAAGLCVQGRAEGRRLLPGRRGGVRGGRRGGAGGGETIPPALPRDAHVIANARWPERKLYRVGPNCAPTLWL
jgi:hypothetical protein